MKVFITGCSGLIGSEAVLFFDRMGCEVIGIDNNMRMDFFGIQGDTRWNLQVLKDQANNFSYYCNDIRDRKQINDIFSNCRFDLIIHCAAQPSHDLAAKRPFDDFDVNAVGTLNLLESFRRYCPQAVFVHMSTNKVYGDAPNNIAMVELKKRWDYADERYKDGIDESFTVDQSTHSLFGASKLSGDIVAQEYGRYFGLQVGIFRGGCLTGTKHSAVELHGFLSFLVKVALTDKQYTIFGYKGKQVRDQIHSHDVVSLFYEFYKNPKCGEVYNLGGGRKNSASILECIDKIEQAAGKKIIYNYSEKNRIGDHICYISNLKKIKKDFPNWKITFSIEEMIEEMIKNYK